jgi:hypothetical protein
MTRTSVPPEPLRARPDTGFSAQLTQYLRRHRALYAVCLVDAEGECVDDASRLGPDEGALIGATWTVLRPVFEEHAKLLGGTVHVFTIDTAQHTYAVRRVSAELSIVIAGGPGALDRRVIEELHALCEAVRDEAGTRADPGDFWGRTVVVEVRASRRWGYAPLRYGTAEASVGPLEVLGRWSEVWAGVTRVCFLVRDDRGDQTLCHDTEQNRWFLR